MTRDEFRQNAAISCIQAIIEASKGIIFEIDHTDAAKLSIALAEALTKEYYDKYPD